MIEKVNLYVKAKKEGLTNISYSQIAKFHNCQWSWKCRYVDKITELQGSIYLIFGNAMHLTLQTYIQTMFEQSQKAADALDLYKILLDEMKTDFIKSSKKLKDKTFTDAETLQEFYEDGKEIIDYFKKHRLKYLSRKHHELIGIEIPIYVKIPGKKVVIIGYIDYGIKDKRDNTILLDDIKTSTRGWKDADKKDFNKSAQLILYKICFAEQFNVDIENIDIEFFIIKRKIWENSEWPQSRVQLHSPASGKVNRNKVSKLIDSFVNHVFDDNGKVKPDATFEKAQFKSSCKWCDYKNTTYCDKQW